jgi:hypothetical protein
MASAESRRLETMSYGVFAILPCALTTLVGMCLLGHAFSASWVIHTVGYLSFSLMIA